MTMRDFVASRPDVITTGVSIFHPQLRDLLQPAGEKGKVLFVHRMGIECADFTTMKAPTHFCSLDFAAVCLTTGSGLVAAGGEHSELDIRPMPPSPGSRNLAHQSTATSEPPLHYAPRPASRWHLRTPTGGSINNSICIQPGRSSTSKALQGVVSLGVEERVKETEDDTETRHREKRRKEDGGKTDVLGAFAWRRDEPWGRSCEAAEHDGLGQSDGLYTLPARVTQGSAEHDLNLGAQDIAPVPGTIARASRPKTVRLLISNNDRSVKAFRLRPPFRNRNANLPSQYERIESGLPGLSRTQTVEFPTCINHSSFSPDGRHVVSVGDTPEVFLFSVNEATGELNKIATYTASSDAAFSSTWSPDGMQFAVASQDGIVSIWDVRSSAKIATLQTSQISDLYGAGAARVVKWSPRGDVLAFSEQQNYVHIVDTITFVTIQRIRIPSLGMVSRTNGSSASVCVNESDRGQPGLDLDDVLLSASGFSGNNSSTVGGGSTLSDNSPNVGEDWLGLESTSPARFASSGRRNDRGGATSLSPQTTVSGPRIRRDFGNPHATRSTFDRALLGEWASGRRSFAGGESGVIRDANRSLSSGTAAVPRRSYAQAVSPPSNEIDWQSEVQATATSAVRSVDSILSGLGDVPERNSAVWSLGPGVVGRLRRRNDVNNVEISGLTWDPDGDYLYVSTGDLIARYTVIDLRRSFGQACLR